MTKEVDTSWFQNKDFHLTGLSVLSRNIDEVDLSSEEWWYLKQDQLALNEFGCSYADMEYRYPNEMERIRYRAYRIWMEAKYQKGLLKGAEHEKDKCSTSNS